MLSQILDELEDVKARLRALQEALDADTLEGGIRPSRWYSVAEVSEREGVASQTVRQWVYDGLFGDEGDGWRQKALRSPIYMLGSAWIRLRRSRGTGRKRRARSAV